MAAVSTQVAEERAVAGPAFPKALPIAVGALGLGIGAQLLFFDVGLGINFPIAIAALLLAAWLAGGPPLRRMRPVDAWLPVAALVFAMFGFLTPAARARLGLTRADLQHKW